MFFWKLSILASIVILRGCCTFVEYVQVEGNLVIWDVLAIVFEVLFLVVRVILHHLEYQLHLLNALNETFIEGVISHRNVVFALQSKKLALLDQVFYACLDVDQCFGDPFELESVPLALLDRPIDILLYVIHLFTRQCLQSVVFQVVQLLLEFLEFLLEGV